LKALRKTDYKTIYKINDISEPIIEQLVVEYNFDATQAAEMFFSSAVFSNLANVELKLYQKNWTEIYELLRIELKK